jgi:hypothetical protein
MFICPLSAYVYVSMNLRIATAPLGSLSACLMKRKGWYYGSTAESGYTAAPQTALLSDGAGTAFLL